MTLAQTPDSLDSCDECLARLTEGLRAAELSGREIEAATLRRFIDQALEIRLGLMEATC